MTRDFNAFVSYQFLVQCYGKWNGKNYDVFIRAIYLKSTIT